MSKKPLLGPQPFCSCLQLHALENNAQWKVYLNELSGKLGEMEASATFSFSSNLLKFRQNLIF